MKVPFTDPVSGDRCALVIRDGRRGIAHPRCLQLADLSMDLDAFYCPVCGRNGRISGAWAADQLRAAGEPASG